ncbi:hypothetical protein OCF67_18260 [Bacillus wiedmannii]|uniref:hypothetical protein n=1 Tax=Bacillus wiedmannii TaxID=1890302 RepID=UPI0021D21F80|nr:hypothetical protein [Bacillus wiedmannii]MCU5706125.1 hypothetical protein [Bacillus wiedmannii]
MHSSIKGAYWDTLENIACKENDKVLIKLMRDVENAVDDELLKQIEEGTFLEGLQHKRAASKS